MSDDLINLVLVFSAIFAFAVIVALPNNWLDRLLGRLGLREQRRVARSPAQEPGRLTCKHCGSISAANAPAWKAYLRANGDVAILCPECAINAPGDMQPSNRSSEDEA
jgi:hypothetical protein